MMTEPTLLGYPISLLFLYFLWYSFLGWFMETCWCSFFKRKFVARGFLKGPICPIYGIGILMMVLFFTGVMGYPALFYAVSTVTLSAWEYFVGWLLEVTTHTRYWDYSQKPFNLHGRIRLDYCLFWGVAAYLVLYFLHPATERLFAGIPLLTRQVLAGVAAVITLADIVTTTRNLAMTTVLMERAKAVNAELDRRREELAQSGRQRLDETRLQAALLQLELKETDLLADAAYYSARFRHRYDHLGSQRYRKLLNRIREESSPLKAHRLARLADRKARKKEEKAAEKKQ
ncbi:MAG: putative ABC transporter permease [Clostridiales bacterium]|nr:putative ABC transporter permease [Clostridiales bacterium]